MQNAFVGDASKALGHYFRLVIDGMSSDVTDLLADKGAASTETSTQMSKLTSELIKLFGERVEYILQNHASRATEGQDGTDARPGGSVKGS